MALQWSDFDFDDLTCLIQRSVVHGRVAEAKTEYSRDRVPLDLALAKLLLDHKCRCRQTPEDWVFASPVTLRPYHQDTFKRITFERPESQRA